MSSTYFQELADSASDLKPLECTQLLFASESHSANPSCANTGLASPSSTMCAPSTERNGGGAIDVICGGYPCQPFSVAGKQLGHEDERHLWPEMLRIIREVKATKPEKELWVIAENVTGHIELGFDEVAASLEAEGFTVWAFVIPASSIGAIHRRDRVWIIAHSNGIGLQGRRKEWSGERVKALPQAPIWRDVPAPYVCRADDGIPDRAHRLKAIGNAVHPYITEIIGHAIMQYRGEIA